MIETVTHEEPKALTLGVLLEFLHYLEDVEHIPKDTPVRILGADGDEPARIALWRRSWEKNEHGCLKEVQPDGTMKQVDELFLLVDEDKP